MKVGEPLRGVRVCTDRRTGTRTLAAPSTSTPPLPNATKMLQTYNPGDVSNRQTSQLYPSSPVQDKTRKERKGPSSFT
ncbi:hypothetical protein EAF00_003608 [Botryotinia globosa]|nr:hypothetical protein EAF00_003608 [Botryotinia globosa]